MQKKRQKNHTYLTLFLPFSLFISLCILIFAVMISMILSGKMKDAYFNTYFYQIVANAISIALIVFSVSFFFSCILAYRPVKTMLDENKDLSMAEQAAKEELTKKLLYELCLYGRTERELSMLKLNADFPLNLGSTMGMCISSVDYFRTFITLSLVEQDTILKQAELTFGSLLKESYPGISLISPDRKYLIILFMAPKEDFADDLCHILRLAQKEILVETKYSMTVACSHRSFFIGEMETVYAECMQMFHQRLFAGRGSLLSAGQEISEKTIKASEFCQQLNYWNDKLVHGELETPDIFSRLLRGYEGNWLGYQTALLSVRGRLEQDILVLENGKYGVQAELVRDRFSFEGCETLEEIETILNDTIIFIGEGYKSADSRRQQGYIDEVEHLIRENHQKCDYGVQQIADEMGLSNTYISKLYKELTGVNVIERLTAYRMDCATHLLLETDVPVTEIYSRIGYSSVNYFYRVFKKHYSITPKQYRELKGGQA